MPKITDITQQQRRKDRFSFFIDGTFRLSLSQNQLVDSRLRIGDEIAEERIEQLLATSEYGKVLDRTYNFISYRMRSRQEVAQYLRRKGCDDELSGQVMDELERRKVIDDKRFAQEWVEMRQLSAPRSRRQLETELRQKGIATTIIETVLATTDPDEEIQIIIRLIHDKRLRQRYGDERKLIHHLSGKGFSYTTIKAALERLSD